MFKKLIGTASVTLTNVNDGREVKIMYSVTGELNPDGSPNLEKWHDPPARKGDIYMIQKVGDQPWGPPVRMEGIPGVSFKMQGLWKYAKKYNGGLNAQTTDLVIYDGATWACIKEHESPLDDNDAILHSEKVPLNSKEVEELRKKLEVGEITEIQTQYWLLTTMAGMQGPEGPAGSSGESSLTLVLSNENHTFIANAAGEILTGSAANTTKTDIMAYLGTQKIEVVDIVYTKPNGLKVQITRTPDAIVGRNVITGLSIQAEPGSHLAQSGILEMTIKASKNSDSPVLEGLKAFSWTKVRDGESPYIIDIVSKGGLVFKKGQAKTTLVATVLYGSQDVTGQMATNLRWYKILKSGAEELWRGTEGKREIEITPADVDGAATFMCKLEI